MLGWPHLLLIFAVVVLLFGATKLPLLARSVGQSARAFKGEMRAMQHDDAAPLSDHTADVPPSTTSATGAHG
jgi:sec-independent protein translocase protein TatA